MDQKLQNKLLKYSLIICFFLILFIILFFHGQNSSYKRNIQELNKENSALQKNIDKAIHIIENNSEQRVKEKKVRDSLENENQRLNLKISSKNKQLSDIQKNKYKGLELDSLLKIAQKIYEKDKHIYSSTNK